MQSSKYHIHIGPRKGFFDIDLKELWRYRDLIVLFVRRDFVSQYKQTILGPLWFIIQPLISTVMFTIVFANIANFSTAGLPPVLFYLSGTIAWNYFSATLLKNLRYLHPKCRYFWKSVFSPLNGTGVYCDL